MFIVHLYLQCVCVCVCVWLFLKIFLHTVIYQVFLTNRNSFQYSNLILMFSSYYFYLQTMKQWTPFFFFFFFYTMLWFGLFWVGLVPWHINYRRLLNDTSTFIHINSTISNNSVQHKNSFCSQTDK